MQTVMFIHGMFMTPLCWEHWRSRFEAKGYTTLAPAWPGREESVRSLNDKHPDPGLGRLSLSDVVNHYTAEIKKRDKRPILVGHSMGGLIAQILLHQDLAAGAVAVDPAPPAGVFSAKWSFLKANWPMVNPFVSQFTPRKMSFEDFQYAFVNTLPLEEQRVAYQRYVVPESRRVPRESTGGIARINFRKQRPPLLIIAGSADNIIPASLNKSNHEKYRHSPSITDFKEFPQRVHFIIGQQGWEEVADFSAAWLKEKIPS